MSTAIETYLPVKPVPPAKPASGPAHSCPRCHQPLTMEPHAWGVLRSGASAMFCGLLLILAAVIRLVRFVVAAAFYFVGSIGDALRAIGARVAHPADRRRLQRWSVLRRRR